MSPRDADLDSVAGNSDSRLVEEFQELERHLRALDARLATEASASCQAESDPVQGSPGSVPSGPVDAGAGAANGASDVAASHAASNCPDEAAQQDIDTEGVRALLLQVLCTGASRYNGSKCGPKNDTIHKGPPQQLVDFWSFTLKNRYPRS